MVFAFNVVVFFNPNHAYYLHFLLRFNRGIWRYATNVIGFLGETKGGDPIPLRQSEVNMVLVQMILG